MAGGRALNKIDPASDWHAVAWNDWLQFILPTIHGHHWAEEAILFPALVRATKVQLPPRMAADHVTLMKNLDLIAANSKTLVAASSLAERKAALEALKASYFAMNKEMQEHLNEEEDILVPAIRESFTEKEFDAVIDKIIQQFNPIDLLWELAPFMGWFRLWCTPQNGCKPGAEEMFRAKVPAPVVWIGEHLTMPRWEDSLRCLKAIEQNTRFTYSRMPKMFELKLLAGVLLVLYLIFKLIALVIRAICCGGKKNASKAKKN